MSTYDELTRLDVNSPVSRIPNNKDQSTSNPTQNTTPVRNKLRVVSSGNPRSKLNRYPTREEIQEFSFTHKISQNFENLEELLADLRFEQRGKFEELYKTLNGMENSF